MKKPVKTKSRSLSGRPGSIRWLMGHELRLFWRRGKMNPRSGVILVGLMLGIWSLASTPEEFEAIHRLNYLSFVEEIPQQTHR